MLHELFPFKFCAGILFIGQLMFEGYNGLLLYNNANSAANFVSSGCRKGWYKYGNGGNNVRDNFKWSESGRMEGNPEAAEMGGINDLERLWFSMLGGKRGDMENPNFGSFFIKGFGFRLGRYL